MLKERNMLLTTEHAYKQAIENMPNQERVDKVCCCFESEGLWPLDAVLYQKVYLPLVDVLNQKFC